MTSCLFRFFFCISFSYMSFFVDNHDMVCYPSSSILFSLFIVLLDYPICSFHSLCFAHAHTVNTLTEELVQIKNVLDQTNRYHVFCTFTRHNWEEAIHLIFVTGSVIYRQRRRSRQYRAVISFPTRCLATRPPQQPQCGPVACSSHHCSRLRSCCCCYCCC